MPVQSKIAGQRGREVHPYLRIVVVTLRLFHTEDWHEISRKTSVEYNTAYKIWRRTTTRADTEFDLIKILSHISTQDCSGCLVTVTDGIPESEQIRRLLDNTYLIFTQVIKQENIPYAQSIVEKIAKEYFSPSILRLIVRKNQQNKCYLDAANCKD